MSRMEVLLKEGDNVYSVPVTELIKDIDGESIEITEDFPISTSLKAIKKLGNSQYAVCLEVQNYFVNMRTTSTSFFRDSCDYIRSLFRELHINPNINIRNYIENKGNGLTLKIEDNVYFYCNVMIQNGSMHPIADTAELSFKFFENCKTDEDETRFCCPNVYDSSKLCLGENASNFSRLALRDMTDLNKIYTYFLGSIFNSDLMRTGYNNSTLTRIVNAIALRAVEDNHELSDVARLLAERTTSTVSDIRNYLPTAYSVITLCNLFDVPISELHKAFI